MATRLLVHEFKCRDFQQAIKGTIPIPANAKKISKIICQPVFPVDEFSTSIPDPIQQYYIAQTVYKPKIGDACGYLSIFKENNSENIINTHYVVEDVDTKNKDLGIRLNEDAENSNLIYVFRKSLNFYQYQRQYDYPNKVWRSWGKSNEENTGKFEVTIKIYIYYKTD